MSWATKTHTFSPATVAKSSEVNQNFDDMVDQINTAAPSGIIAMWSGSIASIPSGWFLCNGANSTPDLRDRFIVGAGSSYSVGDTGGEATHVLTEAEMPSHTHPVPGSAAGGNDAYPINSGTTSGPDSGASYNSGSKGSGDAHENRPPYYALAYIMKS